MHAEADTLDQKSFLSAWNEPVAHVKIESDQGPNFLYFLLGGTFIWLGGLLGQQLGHGLDNLILTIGSLKRSKILNYSWICVKFHCPLFDRVCIWYAYAIYLDACRYAESFDSTILIRAHGSSRVLLNETNNSPCSVLFRVLFHTLFQCVQGV